MKSNVKLNFICKVVTSGEDQKGVSHIAGSKLIIQVTLYIDVVFNYIHWKLTIWTLITAINLIFKKIYIWILFLPSEIYRKKKRWIMGNEWVAFSFIYKQSHCSTYFWLTVWINMWGRWEIFCTNQGNLKQTAFL